MVSKIELSAAVFDTTVIVKGLVPPRRKKKDELYEQQLRIHQLSSSFLKKVEMGLMEMNIPSIALIETAAVVARLTNKDETAQGAATFLRAVSKRILYESEFLGEAINVGIETKTSGFDVVFLTCSKILGLPLLTDDERLTRVAKKYGYNCVCLRDLLEP